MNTQANSVNATEHNETPLTVHFISFAICSTALNGMSIYLTQKYDRFRVPHMYTRVAFALFNIRFVISYAVHYVIALQFPNTPVLFNCLTGDFTIAMFFSITQLTVYVSLEHYFYFCKPMVNNQ